MELRQVESFITVAEEMNYTRAAERLSIAQPALTQQIQSLERSLGTRLFERSANKRISLTPAGQVFMDEGRKLISQAKEAKSAVSLVERGAGGVLDVSYMGTATSPFLADLIRAYREAHPQVSFRLHDLHPEEQYRRFQRSEVDTAFCRDYTIRRANVLSAMSIYTDRLVIAAPEELGHKAKLEDLAEQPAIIYDRKQAPWLVQCVEAMYHQRQVTPKVQAVAQTMDSLLLMVASGQGYAVVPRCLRFARVSGVHFVDIDGPQENVDVFAIWRPEHMSPKLQNWLDLLEEKRPEIRALME